MESKGGVNRLSHFILKDLQLPFCLFHIPWLFDVDGVTIASPGSIAIPKNDSPNSYMIIDNDKIDIKNIDGESILNSIRRDYNQKY